MDKKYDLMYRKCTKQEGGVQLKINRGIIICLKQLLSDCQRHHYIYHPSKLTPSMMNTFSLRGLIAFLLVLTAMGSSAQEAGISKPKVHVYRLELDQAATATQQPLLEKDMKAYEGVQQIEVADKIVTVKGDKTIDMDRIKEIVMAAGLEIRHYTFHLE